MRLRSFIQKCLRRFQQKHIADLKSHVTELAWKSFFTACHRNDGRAIVGSEPPFANRLAQHAAPTANHRFDQLSLPSGRIKLSPLIIGCGQATNLLQVDDNKPTS